MAVIVGMGEILWDMLPGGKQLGGAPANFAFHAARLGHEGIAASRVGADALGEDILSRLRALGLSAEAIQIDREHPTGTVVVAVDSQGQPHYTIAPDAAWDFCELTPGWTVLAARADAVCFGSLAQRSPASREAILGFLRATRPGCLRIFDINLRQHYFSAEILRGGLEIARAAKLNDEELAIICKLLTLSGASELERTRELLSAFNLDLVCLTRGAKGSLLVTANDASEHPGVQVQVADTVGSGDAFVAAVAHHWLKASPLARANEAANALGAAVAARAGATPQLLEEELAPLL